MRSFASRRNILDDKDGDGNESNPADDAVSVSSASSSSSPNPTPPLSPKSNNKGHSSKPAPPNLPDTPDTAKRTLSSSTSSSDTSSSSSITPQRHTFTVTKEEVSRGDHTVAIVWLLRELPQAESLELRFFNSPTEPSFEFTWDIGDRVAKSIDLEVAPDQALPLGTTLLTMVTELAQHVRHLKLYTGLVEQGGEQQQLFSLGMLLKAFAVAGHWNQSGGGSDIGDGNDGRGAASLETLEIHWSCIEAGTFSGLRTFPEKLRTFKLDGCLMVDETEVDTFLTHLPLLESFQVVGTAQDDNRNISMIDI